MRPLALAALMLAAAPAPAQKPAEKPADKPAPIKKPAVAVGGYTAYKIQGFTVLVQAEVLAVPAGTYDRPPLEVLDRELATVAAVMDRKSTDALRQLVVWAEWDDDAEGEAGRGTAIALYRGGSPQSMARRQLHPLKSKTVDVIKLKSLTEEHQPERDSGRCVLLHEFAHAVHDQLLGWENPQVKAAFGQAMERKLYDKTQYASTNAAEFFAELSCSYLDRLGYHPATRADLKAHDPATHKMMETVWGAAARKLPPVPAAKRPAGDPALQLDAVRFGPPLDGEPVTPADLAGRVVVVVWWGGQQANALDRAERLRGELGDYGLTVVAAYPFTRPDEGAIRADAKRRGAGCRVVRGAFVPPSVGAGAPEQQRPPLALVFDAGGACVFRGSVFDADKPARAAVGARLLGEALGGAELPDGLKPAAASLKSGDGLLGAAPKLAPALSSADGPTKEAAARLREALVAPLAASLREALALEKSDPAAAFLAAERVATAGKGVAEGSKAKSLADRLRDSRPVALELKARAALVPISKLAGQLRGQDGAYDPASPRFQSKNAAALAELRRLAEEFRKKHGGTRTAAELDALVGEFGA